MNFNMQKMGTKLKITHQNIQISDDLIESFETSKTCQAGLSLRFFCLMLLLNLTNPPPL